MVNKRGGDNFVGMRRANDEAYKCNSFQLPLPDSALALHVLIESSVALYKQMKPNKPSIQYLQSWG